MQLSRLVDYHRALADPMRLRMLFLLSKNRMNGLDLAESLGISPPTVTHHVSKLRKAGLLKEAREGNSVFFYTDIEAVGSGATGIIEFVSARRDDEEERMEMEELHEREKERVLRAFYTGEGRLKQLPSRYKRRLIVLEEIARRFSHGRKYSECEVNDIISQIHEDYTSIRRYMIECHMLYRDNGIYEVNPRQMWLDWRTVR